MTPLFNHLWQSTLFAAAMAALSLVFRNNHARTRHALWLAASLKFLLPFSLLVAIGDLAQWRNAPVPRQTAEYFTKAVESVSQPFAAPVVAHQSAAAPMANYLPALLLAIWCSGFAAILLTWFGRYRRITTAVRSARPLPLESEVPVRSTTQHLEPGIFGILRPVLLLPDGITDRLTTQQLAAILTHEMCHVRRRDNLTSVLHMAVQAIFWFHPLLWWIGARLVEERELACDEEVLRLGNPPHIYAEGMLNVCRFYLESPLPCVSGVTGGELRKRIEGIMSNRIARRLPATKKLLLAAVSFAAVAVPLVIGLLQAPLGWAQTVSIPPDADPPLTFEVAAIKRAKPGQTGSGVRQLPGGGVDFKNSTAHSIVTYAYDIRDFQLSSDPGWMSVERYDIQAKAEASGPADPRQMTDAQRQTQAAQIRQRVRSLLADRFQLKVRRETKELPVYVLVLAKNGHKLTENKSSVGGSMRINNGTLTAQRMPLQALCHALASQLGRPVINQTGLDGNFDFKIDWSPDSPPVAPGDSPEGASASDPASPSLSAALQQQLGLRLESKKGPVETIVIERVSKPSEN